MKSSELCNKSAIYISYWVCRWSSEMRRDVFLLHLAMLVLLLEVFVLHLVMQDQVILVIFDDEVPNDVVVAEASRKWLSRHSSYFRALLSGNFRESSESEVVMNANLSQLEIFNNYLMGRTEIKSSNFIELYKAALYFGGGRLEDNQLLDACQEWLVACADEDIYDELQLGDLSHIWLYGTTNAIYWMSNNCQKHISRNFMWASSDDFFVHLPEELLLICLKDSDLTVDSERHLCEVLLKWLCANGDGDVSEVLREVRAYNLPVQFVLANSNNLAKLKDFPKELERLKRSNYSDNELKFDSTSMIRLGRYSKIIDLEGCALITSDLLFQSLLPCSQDGSVETLGSYYFKLWPSDFSIWPDGISLGNFTSMREVNISKCSKLHLYPAINCFERAFPNLTKLRMCHFGNFDLIEIYPILLKCYLLEDLDLSVDISPMRSGSKKSRLYPCTHPKRFPPLHHESSSCPLRLKKLTLEGRSELTDHCFSQLAQFLGLLCYLNIKGCSSLTDNGISKVLRGCKRLNSILASDTALDHCFSQLAQFLGLLCYLNIKGCSSLTDNGISKVLRGCKRLNSILASDTALGELTVPLLCKSDLIILDIGGCRGISEASLGSLLSHGVTIQKLCLRDTALSDNTLNQFKGCGLVSLDLSSPKVSEGTMMSLLERTSRLEELRIGWGFPPFYPYMMGHSLKHLKSISLGIGATLPSDGMLELSLICPSLACIDLKFQSISHEIINNSMENLKCLIDLRLSYCFVDDKSPLDMDILACRFYNLLKLKLENVTPGLSNSQLVELGKNCPRIMEIHLRGCSLLDSDALVVIASWWPGIVSLHLEECGSVTSEGVDKLVECKAMEKLHLRHNGKGIPSNFVFEASSKMPLLRVLSVDRCDFDGGQIDLNIPRPESGALRILMMVKCEVCDHLLRSKTDFTTEVWEWSSQGITKTNFKGLI